MSERKTITDDESPSRKSYSDEFKREAVRLCEERGNISGVARDLGIDHSILRKWKRQLSSGTDRPFPGKGNAKDIDLVRLERENARLKEENEILKKAVGIFTNRPR
jgi:transposase